MPYTPTAWEDFPSTDTAITAARLNNMEAGILNADNVLSVLSYGAVGDGVTDDTAEIQAALTAGANAAVYVPPGTYLTSAKLNISSGTHLFGSGAASIIKSNAISSPGDLPGHAQLHASSVTGFRITDLTLDASGITSLTYGMRSILLESCSDFHVSRVRFITPGAATAAIACSNYWITDNYVSQDAYDDAGHHDGVIDNWAASHGFVIRGNVIDFNDDVTPYGILVTGLTTAAAAAGCYDFQIIENRVNDADAVGIWINGVTGINHDFVVANNIIQRVTDDYGIGIADSRRFSVSNNTIQTTGSCGIALRSETASGGVTGAVDGTVAGNVVVDANGLGATGTNWYAAAIAATDNSARLSIVGNRVAGTAHVNAVLLDVGTANCEIIGGNYTAGTAGEAGIVVNTIPSNRVFGSTGNTLPSVASAATMTLPPHWAVVFVSGTTTITSITAGYADQRVTLVFLDALTLTDGSNLFLAGNFVTTAADTITLVCAGSNWFETGRSVN